jgi:hypothetical protein
MAEVTPSYMDQIVHICYSHQPAVKRSLHPRQFKRSGMQNIYSDCTDPWWTWCSFACGHHQPHSPACSVFQIRSSYATLNCSLWELRHAFSCPFYVDCNEMERCCWWTVITRSKVWPQHSSRFKDLFLNYLTMLLQLHSSSQGGWDRLGM